MKTIWTFLLGFTLIIGTNSCMVFAGPQHDNGKHKGWYKNPNNPHNPEHHDEGGGNNEHGKEKENPHGKKN